MSTNLDKLRGLFSLGLYSKNYKTIAPPRKNATEQDVIEILAPFVGDGVGTVTVKAEGVSLTTAVKSIDFVGATVTEPTADNVVVTIEGGGGGATDLEGLSDVDLTTPKVGDSLVYDGTNFINQLPSNRMICAFKFGVTDAVGTPLHDREVALVSSVKAAGITAATLATDKTVAGKYVVTITGFPTTTAWGTISVARVATMANMQFDGGEFNPIVFNATNVVHSGTTCTIDLALNLETALAMTTTVNLQIYVYDAA